MLRENSRVLIVEPSRRKPHDDPNGFALKKGGGLGMGPAAGGRLKEKAEAHWDQN